VRLRTPDHFPLADNLIKYHDDLYVILYSSLSRSDQILSIILFASMSVTCSSAWNDLFSMTQHFLWISGSLFVQSTNIVRIFILNETHQKTQQLIYLFD